MTTTEESISAEESQRLDDARAQAAYDDKMTKALAHLKDCAYEATRTAQQHVLLWRAAEEADTARKAAYEAFDDAKRDLTGVVNNPPQRGSTR